jgi:hypothetical protein
VSCVIGVKALFHDPTIPSVATIITGLDRRLAGMERSSPHERRQDLSSSVRAGTTSESEQAPVVETLRRQRPAGHDKGSGTRSGTRVEQV